MSIHSSLLSLFLLLLLGAPTWAQQRTVFLDSGHTLESPGSLGVCETPEVFVNDHLTLKLTRELQRRGYRVLLSRNLDALDIDNVSDTPAREPGSSLRQRPLEANRRNADLFISIHHDSVKEEALIPMAPSVCDHTVAQPLGIGPAFFEDYQTGFNFFIHSSPDNPRKFDDSLKFSSFMAEEFLRLGEPVADFHTPLYEPSCGSCRWVDQDLGIISRNLAVVRLTNMPSVLVEVTNLKVRAQELKAVDPEFQSSIANGIANAVDKFFR